MLSIEPVSNGDCRPRRLGRQPFSKLLILLTTTSWSVAALRDTGTFDSAGGQGGITPLVTFGHLDTITYAWRHCLHILTVFLYCIVFTIGPTLSKWLMNVAISAYGQSAFYIWGKLCWFVRGSGRELSSLGLLMPTLLMLWVGGRRLSHNAALWLWELSNFSDWDQFPKLYTSCSRSPRGSHYLIDPEGDWMGGCGFLSRADLPGPGALSVSFLGSRFFGFFRTRENCHYIH